MTDYYVITPDFASKMVSVGGGLYSGQQVSNQAGYVAPTGALSFPSYTAFNNYIESKVAILPADSGAYTTAQAIASGKTVYAATGTLIAPGQADNPTNGGGLLSDTTLPLLIGLAAVVLLKKR